MELSIMMDSLILAYVQAIIDVVKALKSQHLESNNSSILSWLSNMSLISPIDNIALLLVPVTIWRSSKSWTINISNFSTINNAISASMIG